MDLEKLCIPLRTTIIGNTNTGKTTFVNNFFEGQVYDSHEKTFGYNTLKKSMQYEINGEPINFCLQCWDTAGDTVNRRITSNHYERVFAAIFFYDITDKKSFEDLNENWIEEFTKSCRKDCKLF